MHCSQPLYGIGGPNNMGHFYNCNHPISQIPYPSVYPEIIGEGEVASVVYPDGSIQWYFIPFNKRYAYTNFTSFNPYNNNSVGAYYVRSISNPITPAVFNQECQKIYAGSHPRHYFTNDSNLSPGFQLKFHNDCWTSTTDLHYFFPYLRQCEWFPSTQPKGCASIQVDAPAHEKKCNQELACIIKPCSCSRSDGKSCIGTEAVDECLCIQYSHSANSIKSTRKPCKQCKSFKSHKNKIQKQKSDVVCECHEANTTDKNTATYADQASNCIADNERDTQTCMSACEVATSYAGTSNFMNKSSGKTELWYPKTPFGEKAIHKKSSEKILKVHESTCSSATCCCSDAEGE